MAIPLLSIVIPVFNSESKLERLILRIHNLCIEEKFTYEIIAINDFSSDNSWETLVSLTKVYDNLKLVNFEKKCGEQSATLCGILNSSGEYIVTIADNMKFLPEDIQILVFAIRRTNVKLIYGYNELIDKNKLVNAFANWIKKAVCGLSGISIFHSTFRIIMRESILHLSSNTPNYFFIDGLIKKEIRPHSYVNVNKPELGVKTRKHSSGQYMLIWIRHLVTSSNYGEYLTALLLLANILIVVYANILLAPMLIILAIIILFFTLKIKWIEKPAFVVKEKVNL